MKFTDKEIEIQRQANVVHELEQRQEEAAFQEPQFSERSSFGCTPEQYHDGLDKLWKALKVEGDQDKDVFTLVAERIALLEWQLEDAKKRENRLREFIDFYSYVTRMGVNQTYGVKARWQDDMKELGFNIP